jgi:hypothetical protein
MFDRPLCRHCRRNPVNRPRGLCRGCYYAPGVRDLYPSESKFVFRGVGNTPPKRHPAPTAALQGTPAKLAALEARAAAGEHL